MFFREKTIVFEGWFSLDLPAGWEYYTEDELLNVYAKRKPKGALQVSFYHSQSSGTLEEKACALINDFAEQSNINSPDDSPIVILTPDHVFAMLEGNDGDSYVKLYSVVSPDRFLIATYISEKQTREVSAVDDIVFSVDFSAG